MASFQFHPVIARWFEEKFGSPTEPQHFGWPAIQSGTHTLIAAPTGSGKTLAAFFASLDHLFREGLAGTLQDLTRVVYVSPLKALSNDIHKNLEEPLAGLRAALRACEGRDVDVRAAVRTGDTPSAKRQALTRKPPHILVTTPESLYLLLTSQSGRKMLATVRTLIVDEIHAVVANRRGSHLALSMERLAALVDGPLQRIGLSATQRPIEEVAKFLVGCPIDRTLTPALSLSERERESLPPPCAIVDAGYRREMDVAIELPGSPLEAVMSNEIWTEVYQRLAALIEAHRTTLVFVNTRRLAERVTHHLCERLGKDQVTAHHGSLSAALRLDAEQRLKRGELKALVATASLELGIDIGSVDLVCQLGPTRSISTLLQRVGRAQHQRGGLPKGRFFPLSRDELVESVATLRSVRNGELDCLHIPDKPLDVLAQQIVACAACEDCDEQRLFELMRSAYPYRNLTTEEFDDVLRMLAEGFSTKRGRRGALIHYDAIGHRVRARRGARLVALTSGGAIPDNADYRVMLEPGETFIGTVNEDFAIESQAGDIFQLGNASWRILRVNSGQVRVEDAHGQPPSIPFWLGEAPGRTAEVSRAVSDLRSEIEEKIADEHPISKRQGTAALPSPSTGLNERFGESGTSASQLVANESPMPGPLLAPSSQAAGIASARSGTIIQWLANERGLPETGARQLADYFAATYKALGVIPSQKKLVLERFFDESGGMQLVLHSPFGIRVNRAWGLALRKRFCRSFNFELQAAATDDAIVLSLGTQHSFPLAEVFGYLNSKTVRDLLVQALLDAPMFPIRWRWNATRALALPRQRGGRKIPAPLQRMESENLLAAVFPDQLACLENIAGDREVPSHPLVRQTIEDCLTEAMDVDGLIAVLQEIECGTVECIARDLPEPSPLAHEILNARPYAFLDNAPLEERRTQAVYTRRSSESVLESGLGRLDAAAIEKVCVESWPRAVNPDELHEALLLAGVMTEAELQRTASSAESSSAGGATENSLRLQPCENDARPNKLHKGRLSSKDTSAAPSGLEVQSSRTQGLSSRLFPAAPPGPTLSRSLLESLVEAKRAGQLAHSRRFWLAAERLPIVQAVYPNCPVEPPLIPPPSESKRRWDRADALRELVRGRMEICGPTTTRALAEFFELPPLEIETAMLALEAEGFILRGKFRPNAQEQEWCERRLLARIHRLTIGRLRAEIQPVSVAEFLRFLIAWQRVDSEHHAEGPAGVEAVLDLLNGYELPAAAWEPDVLALRVNDYSPQWLDQLCLCGRIGWGRLTPPQNQASKPFAPLRSSPVSLFSREHLPDWLELSPEPVVAAFSPDTRHVWETLCRSGALFFGEIVKQTGILPSRVEQALAELAAHGWLTSDSFEGLRALLLPAEKRSPFADLQRKRHHKSVTSIEFAGRWSLLRSSSSSFSSSSSNPGPEDRGQARNSKPAEQVGLRQANTIEAAAVNHDPDTREAAIESFARALLRRYGLVFRRMLEREPFEVSWYELGRVYRRLEARGEIRGGHFVSGVSGEQFALPEAIGLLRSIRKNRPKGELITISAADPLNFVGILTPGPRLPAIAANRILLRDGAPIAALETGQIVPLSPEAGELNGEIERALRIGTLPVALRPYYA